MLLYTIGFPLFVFLVILYLACMSCVHRSIPAVLLFTLLVSGHSLFESIKIKYLYLAFHVKSVHTRLHTLGRCLAVVLGRLICFRYMLGWVCQSSYNIWSCFGQHSQAFSGEACNLMHMCPHTCKSVQTGDKLYMQIKLGYMFLLHNCLCLIKICGSIIYA